MALIYKRPPFYKVQKDWENNDTLFECYKLQSNNPPNKSHVKIHKDNGKYGIKLTVNKTVPEFNKGAEKCNLTWVDSFMEFKNVLQGQHRTAWKQTHHKHVPEPGNETISVPAVQDCNSGENFHKALQLFLQQQTLNKKCLEIGSVSTFNPAETTSSRSP